MDEYLAELARQARGRSHREAWMRRRVSIEQQISIEHARVSEALRNWNALWETHQVNMAHRLAGLRAQLDHLERRVAALEDHAKRHGTATGSGAAPAAHASGDTDTA